MNLNHFNLLRLFKASHRSYFLAESVVLSRLHTSTFYRQECVENKQFALSFEEYQKLKRSLKTKQRMAGIPFAFIGMACSSFVTAYLYPDMFDATPENVQLIMGLDPLVFSGVTGVAAAGVGFVVGTSFFKVLWKTMNKQQADELSTRDVDFLKRLDRFRFGGDSKFEDDYYGETIKTLSDYRQWVRTQQRKKENHAKYNLQSKEEKSNVTQHT